MLSIADIVRATNGKLLQTGRIRSAARVCINSREIRKNDLFIAIKGEKFDGHQFIAQAFRKGAKHFLVSKRIKVPKNVNVILVENTARALGLIAREHRRKFLIPVIAITGSTGKTTTKEMIAIILKTKLKVLKNTKTENNHIGVPLTLLKLKPAHQAAVIEFGTNQPGDIKWLAQVTEPNMAVFTNIGDAHLAGLKSRRGVFREKSSLIKFMKRGEPVLFNNDDVYLRKLKTVFKNRRFVSFGIDRMSHFKADQICAEKGGLSFKVRSRKYQLKTFAVHNVGNALAAISCGSLLGITYNKSINSLGNFRFPDGRFYLKRIGAKLIINDTYNANPLSTRCALESLRKLPVKGRRIAVLADMLELGPRSDKFHVELGRLCADLNLNGLLTYGFKASRIQKAFKSADSDFSKHFLDLDVLNRYLLKKLERHDAVLVKGSRSMKMERTVNYLMKNL